MSTLIVTATPADGGDAARGRYLQSVMPLLMNAGGKPVKRLRVTETLTGDPETGIVLVMDFQHAESISGVVASDDYQKLIADRDEGFSNIQMLITEDMPLATSPSQTEDS
jgi:uncharacterized protein (DUF1330 family)